MRLPILVQADVALAPQMAAGDLVEPIGDPLPAEVGANFYQLLLAKSRGEILQKPRAIEILCGAVGESHWRRGDLPNGLGLSLEYSRPWEGGTKAVQTFDLSVVVE